MAGADGNRTCPRRHTVRSGAPPRLRQQPFSKNIIISLNTLSQKTGRFEKQLYTLFLTLLIIFLLRFS
jgi:hypothetical protein